MEGRKRSGYETNKVEFMAHCELTQEVGHEHHCIDIGVNHAVDHREAKYSTVRVGVSIEMVEFNCFTDWIAIVAESIPHVG